MQREAGDAGLQKLLNEGIEQLGIAVTDAQRQKLLDYVTLLGKWNAVYNLTAIRDPRQMLIQHILDSLAIIPFITRRTEPQSALDVGSGGGLPGIVMAIVLPDWKVTLNDIVHKKTAFQSQAKLQLGLTNLSVVTGRVENLHPGVEVPGLFDVIVSRAFAELSDFVTLARHLVAGNGRIWAMKGIRPDAEIARLPADTKVCCIERLRVPMLDAERHLIELEIGAAPH
ncbi:16S rRNA (guanine(527)-N(7))-methyltransferase RsmG [Caballeronia sordidicola]|jgi:16S rRNA (guanine527-N7)-methyltransferase|uniref:Ribosomal RNA small subunit methyltransferase G n=1 Tax=Caballeronia sordidicola TaxID=196367 RepID=A0A226X7Z4_CABSO|nr:16S rRNA (guanine(527)-N(7))-methyltransferase RsmG [Caballeronia sordidicola]OXC79574.1 rRNA small subunit 7-methylguanosine (m7G) methyltransferase GidB [Caballeronia sordidicola]